MRNILYIDAHNPFEPQKGGASQRSHLLVEALAQFAHVDVVVLRPGAVSDVNNADVIFSDWGNTYYDEIRSWKLKRLLRPWSIESFFPAIEINQKILYPIIDDGQYDYIFVRYLDVALQCGLQKYNDRLIVDVDDRLDDVEWMLAKQAKTLRSKLYHGYVSLSMKYSLNKAIKSFVVAFFPNKSQARYVNSVYLPNIPYYSSSQLPMPESRDGQILFVGDLRYEPNFIGIEHFIKHILPLIQKEKPNVRLELVGKCCEDKRLKWGKIAGVIVKGFVEDIQDVYRDANVCVIPVYNGAGTNIKVLETLQMGRACVITENSYKGFAECFISGRDLYVVKTDKEFAERVIELLNNPVKNADMARNGYAAVNAHFSRRKFNAIVKEAIEKL